MKILSLKARQILDSRGNPTIEAELKTSKGTFFGVAPSGASTGKHEAFELRDGKKEYSGKSVLKAVSNVNSIIARSVIGKDFSSQSELDEFLIKLDWTNNKSKLGANAILSVSMANCRAMAFENNMELFEFVGSLSGNKNFVLPVPQLNVMNGGEHAGRKNDIQEHMILPVKFDSFSEALRAGTETYHVLKNILKKKYGYQGALVGDEGGFVPNIEVVETRLELMLKAIKDAGYSGKIKLALDCAASEFYSNGQYKIGKKVFSPEQLVNFYEILCKKYSIASIEDGMAEDDWVSWRLLNEKIGSKVQLVGDDLLVTNVDRIKTALAEKACNALLLKVNQIGTITESIKASALALKNNWNVIVSHRSGETEDSFIADFAVGLGIGQSKFGAPARSDRNSKYNQLLRIEEKLLEMGKKPVFAKM
ncbi:MAG TPA: phosphopyruvate hydratase [archaeon]|nr:phosphopyruvate hydratase [archaeon]